MLNVTHTFVSVAPDCPATASVIPKSARDKKPIHVLQYELLSQNPYKYNLKELIFEVYIRHKEIPQEKVSAKHDEIWDDLFSKNHPCLRASMLPKKYGWGVHYDKSGKIALYPMESGQYQAFLKDDKLDVQVAMRNKKA